MTAPQFELPCPDISMWRQGNTGTEGVWHFDSGQPGRHVLISALIHGNELCGAWAIKGLLEAGVRPARGKLTLVLANLRAFERFDPAHHDASRFVDEDMNRQWMDERIAEPRTLERQRVAALAPWVRQADWVLDLHSMHEPGAPLLLTGIQPRNQQLARQLANPVHIVVDAGHKDGVRMRDYAHFGWPDAQAPDSRSSASALQAALPGWRLPDAPQQWALEVTGPVVARSAAFRFTQPFTGLECIPKAGTVIGDNDGEAVTTPYDDCVLVMPSVRQARAGVTVVRFARRRLLTA